MSNSNTMSKTMSDSNTMSNTDTMSKGNSMSKADTMSNNSGMSNSMHGVCNSMSNWVGNSVSISSNTIISHISNITIIIIGMVVDMLDTAIGKVDRVGSLDNTGTIIGLSLVEGSTRVVISNSIGVRVGRDLSKVRLGISSNWVSYSNTMSKTNSMSQSNSMSQANSMSKTVTSQKLRGSRCYSNDGGKAGKGLKY
jgi:hypothetical protein